MAPAFRRMIICLMTEELYWSKLKWKTLHNDGKLASKGRLWGVIYELLITGVCEMEAKAKRRVTNELSLQKKKNYLAEDLKQLAVKYFLAILHSLPTDGVSQLAISVVQYTGTWSNIPERGPIYRNVVQYSGSHSGEPVGRYLQSQWNFALQTLFIHCDLPTSLCL